MTKWGSLWGCRTGSVFQSQKPRVTDSINRLREAPYSWMQKKHVNNVKLKLDQQCSAHRQAIYPTAVIYLKALQLALCLMRRLNTLPITENKAKDVCYPQLYCSQ